jgi:hypothetical protein
MISPQQGQDSRSLLTKLKLGCTGEMGWFFDTLGTVGASAWGSIGSRAGVRGFFLPKIRPKSDIPAPVKC